MRIEFTKMHGLGNDFAVFDAPADGRLPTRAGWRSLADRRTGIGFDQALVLEAPRRADTAIYYRIFNADGAEVEQCGNGARCVALLLHRRGRANGPTIAMDSLGGPVLARIEGDGVVAVDMGAPRFDPPALPFLAAGEAPTYRLEVGGSTVEIGAVSMGNPHAVLIVPSVATAPVAELGPAIERDAHFPNRVNVGFMEIVRRNEIRLRVFERGAGETLACGTGACGAVAVGQRLGRLDAQVLVHAPGGDLEVRTSGPGESIWLTGPAAVSFSGHIDI
jgi:diaminopimelate epimerase